MERRIKRSSKKSTEAQMNNFHEARNLSHSEKCGKKCYEMQENVRKLLENVRKLLHNVRKLLDHVRKLKKTLESARKYYKIQNTLENSRKCQAMLENAGKH